MDNFNESGLVVVESQGVDVFEAQERAAIDMQIATAKRWPRSLPRVRDNSIAIVCMDKKTAETVQYAKPVQGKTITGPSVHLARIVSQQYGNIRVQQRIKQITDRTIVAEAVAFDLETNYAVAVEARRSIIDKSGRRYAESVIETNAMATLAIAERNAILKVIPRSLVDAVYNAAIDFVNAQLSDKEKFLIERKRIFSFFEEKYDVKEENLLQLLELRSSGQVKVEHLTTLRGYLQSIKDGEVSPNELFGKKTDVPDDPIREKPADPLKGAKKNNAQLEGQSPKLL